MSMQARASASLFLSATLLSCLPAAARGDAIFTAPTASIPLTATNWGPASGSLAGKDPLSIQQFDPAKGTLDAVTLTFNTQVSVDYHLTTLTPGTTTGSVATGSASSPGPEVTLYRPDGVTPLLSVVSPSEPSFLTQTSGSTANQQGPLNVERAYTLTLNSPSDLALFTGTGSVSLPVSASAVSMLSSSSGNGFGSITTQVGVDLTVSYQYKPAPAAQEVPEASAVWLWSLAGFGLAAVAWRRRSALAG